MAAICKKNGFALVTSLFIMLLLLTLVLYLASFTLTELRISTSQSASVQTYYLAEAGIAEAIWKIKNDPIWKNGFEGSALWSVDYTRNSALYPNGSYRIQITNTEQARGDITVTASLNLGVATAKRVVKTTVYKALGESVVGQNGEYADGNIDMSGSVLNVFNGGLFSNINIIINFWSIISADGAVQAVGNINVNPQSHLIASSTHASNLNPPAPATIAMPAVSFDNAGDPDSYKAQANNIYTASQFSDLLWANRGGTLTLNGITYVTGAVTIYGGNNLIINGVLVADGNIKVGANTLFCCWGSSCLNRSNVTINNTGGNAPSGLLSKGRIDFELCLNNFTAKGMIYANDKINILSLPNAIDVTGGLISRKITLTSLWQGINIIYDNSVINYTLGDPQFSPIVTVEHWEEEY